MKDILALESFLKLKKAPLKNRTWGYHYVIDLDLKAYFDTVNHDLLMKFLTQYFDDPWLLRLVRKFLASGVMNGRLFEQSA